MSDEFKTSGLSSDAEIPLENIPLSPELIRDLPEDIRGKLIEEITHTRFASNFRLDHCLLEDSLLS